MINRSHPQLTLRHRFASLRRGGLPTLSVLAVLISLAQASPAGAGYTNPNPTTFLPTYTGTQAIDLETVYIDVTYNAAKNDFNFTAIMNGAIGTTPGALYVFGLNRGLGTARFTAGNPSIGQNVLFDSVLILNATGTGQFNDFINSSNSTPISSGITISGNTITAELSASLFPSEGFALSQYTYNFWPRLGAGQNSQIAQFVPANMNLGVSSVPEPASSLLLGIGGSLAMAVFGRTRVRRQKATAP